MSKTFDQLKEFETFYRKVGGAVFVMVKAPDGYSQGERSGYPDHTSNLAIMKADAADAAAGMPVIHYQIPPDELTLSQEAADRAKAEGRLYEQLPEGRDPHV